MVQWLGLCTFTAEGPRSIPGQGTKIPQAAQSSAAKKRNKNAEEMTTLENHQSLTSNEIMDLGNEHQWMLKSLG